LWTIIGHLRKFRTNKRGISNVIVIVLSLVILVIIASNVILWSYQMNQLDWEKMQENVEIANVTQVTNSPWFATQSEYAVNIGNYESGSYTDTQTVNGEYETFSEGDSVQGWLTGWSKRVRITVDHNDIDSALVDFPVLIYLSSSSGLNSANVSFVFNEIGANRKKIAVTTGDGATECYVEIEKWDAANKEAWLWVKVPSISSSQDTVLYLYFDNTHADNTAYVGDTGSAVAENVWDGNFKFVMHFPETSGIHYDSTSNNNDGTAQGGVTKDAVGKIDGADDFDGINDRIRVRDSSSLSFTNNALTIEAWVKLDTLPTAETAILRKDMQWQIGFIDSNTIRNLVRTNGATGWTAANDEDYTFQTNTWYYWTFVYDGSKIVHEINAAQVGSTHTVTGSIVDNSNPVYIAYCVYTNEYLDGVIDEIRISNTARSAAWIKASYENGRDDLVAYGNEEVAGAEQNELDIVGTFVIPPSVYPQAYIQTVEIQIKYRASDTGENWFLEAYNWTGTGYSDNGFNSTAGHTPTLGWDYSAVNLTDKWQSYLQANGTLKIKFRDAGNDNNQTIIDIDFLAVRVRINGTLFSFKNTGALTCHIVSIWIENSTTHTRYETNIYVNSGETVNYIRADISIADSTTHLVKVTTERGNIAVYSPS